MRSIKKWSFTQVMVFGFLVLILVGACILMLPICNANGKWLNFPDALFTSCTCVCVTGLVTVVPAFQFTFLGKLVMLFLIQVGGWGVIVCVTYVLVLMKVKLTIQERVMLQNYFNRDSMRGLVGILQYVVKGSLVVEGIGALGYACRFIPQFGLLRGIWYAVFHSISAFCNAGFDILGTTDHTFVSLTGYSRNIWLNIVIMLLIILGGIGFLTWEDFYTNKFKFKRYRMQSKVILITTAILIIAPAVFFFACDFGNLPAGKRLLASVFQSVTTRTAGFNTEDLSLMTEAGKAVMILLMLIGGSPSSTAGGMKTTTFAVLILNALATFRSREDAGAFGRRFDGQVVKNAATIAMMYFMLFFFGGITISVYEGLPLLTCLYEAASAVGTVGLTLGITPELHIISRLILIALMYLGRVGGMTLIYAVFSRKNNNGAKMPLEKITVG